MVQTAEAVPLSKTGIFHQCLKLEPISDASAKVAGFLIQREGMVFVCDAPLAFDFV